MTIHSHGAPARSGSCRQRPLLLEDDGELSLAVESQQVAQERVIWRTRITVPASDLLAMRGRIAEHIHQGLLPRARRCRQSGVGIEALSRCGLSTVSAQPCASATAEVVRAGHRDAGAGGGAGPGIRPGLAYPRSSLLRVRYLVRRHRGSEGKSLAAHRKALELDPGLIAAARNIGTHRTEAGDLEGAYLEARRLLDQFGPTADTHFTISYVYRYGGLLDATGLERPAARPCYPHRPSSIAPSPCSSASTDFSLKPPCASH